MTAQTSSTKSKEAGSLSGAAIALENDFKEVDRLSKALQEITTGPITNLKQAQKLLLHFSETGLRVGEEIQALAKALDEGRQRAEASTQSAANAADLIKKVEAERNSLFDQFQALALRVQQTSASLSHFAKSSDREDQDASRKDLKERLPSLQSEIEQFISEAETLGQEAKSKFFSDIAKDAEAMAKSLKTTRQKLKMVSENLSKS